MTKAYLEEDLLLIQHYFPGATVLADTTFDMSFRERRVSWSDLAARQLSAACKPPATGQGR